MHLTRIVPHAKPHSATVSMTPWVLLDTATIPGNNRQLRLYQRGQEYSIKITGEGELMNSRVHGSEDALAELACARLAGSHRKTILIGGLGMGFTLAAALRNVSSTAQVEVAELIPDVVRWNHGPLGEAAGHPLKDARVMVREDDVARVLTKQRGAYDAILLDVDNGPEGLTRKQNDWLYSLSGLTTAFEALRAHGVLAVWSAGADRHFTSRLHKVGFDVEEIRTRARPNGKGSHHVIWLGIRPK